MALTLTSSKSIGNPIHVYEGDQDLVSVAAAGTQMAEVVFHVTGLGATDIPISFTVYETGFKLSVANYFVESAGHLNVVFSNPDDAAFDAAATVGFRLVCIAAT